MWRTAQPCRVGPPGPPSAAFAPLHPHSERCFWPAPFASPAGRIGALFRRVENSGAWASVHASVRPSEFFAIIGNDSTTKALRQ